jgi:hypothetical protein
LFEERVGHFHVVLNIRVVEGDGVDGWGGQDLGLGVQAVGLHVGVGELGLVLAFWKVIVIVPPALVISEQVQ